MIEETFSSAYFIFFPFEILAMSKVSWDAVFAQLVFHFIVLRKEWKLSSFPSVYYFIIFCWFKILHFTSLIEWSEWTLLEKALLTFPSFLIVFYSSSRNFKWKYFSFPNLYGWYFCISVTYLSGGFIISVDNIGRQGAAYLIRID